MPSYQKLWEENRDKGLNVFLFETDSGSTEDQVFAFLMQRGITVPAFVGAPEGYKGDGGQPYHIVIGVDGKIAFSGNGHCEDVIKSELGKIKYPGLGKHSVAKGLEKAATHFAKKEYQKALEEAAKVLEKEKEGAAATDAQYIIDRCNALMSALQAKAEAALGEKDYLRATRALDELATGFKGAEAGTAAATKLKEIKDDKEAGKELEAQKAYVKAKDGLKNLKTKTDKAKSLRDFAKKHDGTKASEDARALAKRIEAN